MLRKYDDATFWNRVARKYATDRIKDMTGYDRTIERTRQLLRSSDGALELGCGTGTTALKLAPHVDHILATDVSSEMITIGREKATVQACANIEFAYVGADNLVAPDSSFDVYNGFQCLAFDRGSNSGAQTRSSSVETG